MAEEKIVVGVTVPGEQLLTAIFNFATEVVKGQPQEFKTNFWNRIDKLVTRINKDLGVE